MFWSCRESHTRCPVDNEELLETDLFADNFAKREIQNFNVRCPNSKQGCDVITTVKQLPVSRPFSCQLAVSAAEIGWLVDKWLGWLPGSTITVKKKRCVCVISSFNNTSPDMKDLDR